MSTSPVPPPGTAVSDWGSDPGPRPESPQPNPGLYHELRSISVKTPPPEQEKCCSCCDTLKARLLAIYESCVKCYREI